MDNPEARETFGTEQKPKTNKATKKKKQTKKTNTHTTKKTKKISSTDHTKTEAKPRFSTGKQFLLHIRHPSCRL